jgi:hypothetical protein
MSNSPTLQAGRRRLARAGAAVAVMATFGALATSTAMASSAPEAIFCWKEYDLTRSGNTVIASAFKDCVDYDVPQPLNVSIKKWYSDEWGYSGWITAGSGLGVATAACNPFWPTTYRHSISGEQIVC